MGKLRVLDISDCKNFSFYQNELVEIYSRAFGEPPWNEVFNEKEVLTWFSEMNMCSGKIVLVMYYGQKLVGATFCVNADLEHNVWVYLPEGVARQEVIYLSESFIDPAYQRKGLGGVLHDRRLELARKQGYKYALQRTSEQSGMFPLIQRTGFEEIGRQIVRSRKKINGVINDYPDDRIISLKKL